MADAVSIRMIGDWNKGVNAPLSNALHVSMDMFRRTAPEACKHAVILMAQSAKNMTPKAKKNRPVLSDVHGPYFEKYKQGMASPRKVYRWMFKKNAGDAYKAAFLKAKVIRNAGLAKRSWMWGLGSGGAGIPGASVVSATQSGKVFTFLKQNKLGYVAKIMPAGWEAAVAAKAVNRIMAQAARKLASAWERSMGHSGASLSDFMGRRAA